MFPNKITPLETLRRPPDEYATPAPAIYTLGSLRHRLWNRLAVRPMVYWRNAFWRLDRVERHTCSRRRPASIWGFVFSRRRP